MSEKDPRSKRAAICELSVGATFAGVREGLETVRRGCLAQGVPGEVTDNLELVLAETLNNIVEHAFSSSQDGKIDVSVRCEPRGIECLLVDGGKPMPQGVLPKGAVPDLSTDRSDLPEGGFGWFLINSLARNIRYRRIDRHNHLTFKVPTAM